MGLAEDEDNDVLEGVDDAEAVAVDEAVPVLVDVNEGVVVLLALGESEADADDVALADAEVVDKLDPVDEPVPSGVPEAEAEDNDEPEAVPDKVPSGDVLAVDDPKAEGV